MKFAAIDFETANHKTNSACAIGIVRIENQKIVKTMYSLIRPPSNTFEFSHIHGITWKDVEQSPTFEDLWITMQEAIKKVDFLVAHHAIFDRQVLLDCCCHYNIPINHIDFLCTVKVARQVWNISPATLANVCHFLNIKLQHHHALSDAIACSQILTKAEETIGKDIIYKSFSIDRGRLEW